MNTNGNLNGYFPSTTPMTIGGIVVVAALGFVAYQALKGKKRKSKR